MEKADFTFVIQETVGDSGFHREFAHQNSGVEDEVVLAHLRALLHNLENSYQASFDEKLGTSSGE